MAGGQQWRQVPAGLSCGRVAWQGRGMSEIVNLNRERKKRGRAAAARQAAENRVAHGQTRAERLALEQAALRRAAVLDGARLETGAAQDESPEGGSQGTGASPGGGKGA